ncbi:nucleolar protein 14, partial [Dipodascopsis tothii]|uniref:nucleolar protein 14 n=1 Tax=Dipodascopsis tothii TaxID=44089 RepID=UPI0034D01358
MGESQLKKLKARLKASGMVGQTNVKNKKQAKRLPAMARSDKDSIIESIREEFNPFEIKVNRQKHGDILGRRVQGATGRPGISKQIGEETRRRTLQAEMARKNKVGGIVDRRFGEYDSTMTAEEKMLERFTRERQSRSARSGSLFNLEDEDEEDFSSVSLTHMGESLSTRGFEDVPEAQSDDELLLKRPHGAGEEGSDDDSDGPDRKKSKNEVMKELIAKSKMHKHERQQAKEDDLEAIEDLDNEIDDIRMMLFRADQSQDVRRVAEPEKDLDYDAQVREMAFDKRAKPSDRTKTEDELAEERAEQLKELEAARLRRMRGEVETEVNDDRRRRAPEADDLADDFETDDVDDAAEFGLGRTLADADAEESAAESGSDADSAADSDAAGGSDSASDDSASVFDFSDDEPATAAAAVPARKLVKSKSAPALAELAAEPSKVAFTYPCPATYGEFAEIIAGVEPADVPVVVDRIIVLHHPSLAKDNKVKLMKFGGIVLEHVLALVDESELTQDVLNALLGHLHKLCQAYPDVLAGAFRVKLAAVRERMDAAVAGRETDYPLPSDMLLFAVIGMLFSTSDHFHLVATPAMLLMEKHLSQVRVANLGELASKAFVLAVSAKYQRLSKRYVPYAMNFVNQTLVTMAKIKPAQVPATVPLPNGELRTFAGGDSRAVALRPLKLSDVMVDTAADALTSAAERQLLLSVYQSVLASARDLGSLWKGKEAYREIFQPSVALLEHVAAHGSAAALGPVRADVDATLAALQQLVKLQSAHRAPLALQHYKAMAIPTYAPKFEENYNVDKKSYDPDVQRQEIGKLKAQVKKERKGALRELRKDSRFIAREKIKERREKDQQYHEMLAKLERSIQTEEGAEKNKYEREKRARKGKKK